MLKLPVVAIATIAIAAIALFNLWPSEAVHDDACPAQFADGRAPDHAADRGRTLCFSQFAVRYSGATRTPIWSAERLTSERVRSASGMRRTGDFHEETRLPYAERAELSDYRRSGYDRGHMAPSGDMPDRASQNESFSLANMIPQHPCSNQGLWSGIESAVRTMAIQQGEIFVVTGPIYDGSMPARSVGRGVRVPDKLYKAVYDPVTGQAGAYLADNADGMFWRTVSIDDLKDMTGIDVFPSLPPDAKLEGMQMPAPEKSRYKCRLHSSGEIPK